MEAHVDVESKSYLQITRKIKPKRVTNQKGPIPYPGLSARATQLLTKKYRIGCEPLAVVRLI